MRREAGEAKAADRGRVNPPCPPVGQRWVSLWTTEPCLSPHSLAALPLTHAHSLGKARAHPLALC